MLIEDAEQAGQVIPSLVAALSACAPMELERAGAERVAKFLREHGDPGFFVPRAFGGRGGSIAEMVSVLRYVGAHCPSLAIAMTMHHHTVAAFARGCIPMATTRSFLKRVAAQRALVSSAFAEGRPGADILRSSVRCTELSDGQTFSIEGSKKPSTMAQYASFSVVGVAMGGDGESRRGIALVDRSLPGTRTEEFWPSQLLASAGSQCIIFEGVRVSEECLLAPRGNPAQVAKAQLAVAHAEVSFSGLFQVMVAAAYIGMAGRLCEIVLENRSGSSADRVDVLSRIEAAALSVDSLAALVEQREFSDRLLARSMLVAHHAANQVDRVAAKICRMLGGMRFLAEEEVQYLLLATRCMHFHPPSTAVRERIVDDCFAS